MLAYLLGVSAFAALTFFLVKHLRNIYIRPSAPGPFLARWSDLWLVFKVNGGSFEKWSIKQHASAGKIVRVGPSKYSIDDPEAAKQIYGFHNAFKKTEWYTAFGEPKYGADDNVFSVQNRQLHAQMRKRQAAFYAMSSIKSYEPYVDECVTSMIKQFDAISTSRSTFDLQVWLQCYAFDAISQMTFGNRHNFIEEGKDKEGMMEFIWNVQSFSNILALTYPWGLPILLLKYGFPTAGIAAFVDRLRDKAREKHSGVTLEDADDEKPMTFYQKTVRLERADPEAFHKYRVTAVNQQNMMAGSDTTSIALTSVIHNCIKYPNVWRKLRDELREAVDSGNVGFPISFEESQRLPYLQRVLKEGIRTHASIGLPLWREVPEGGADIAGKFFPAGTWVGINPWVAHNNKSVFGDDAAYFNPDRWDPVTTPKHKLDQMEAYSMAFGAGTRVCLGRHIAHLEMSKLVPELVRRYDLELVNPQAELDTENNFFVKQKHLEARIYAHEKPF